jgi:Protein of unknown function (DUF2917)
MTTRRTPNTLNSLPSPAAQPLFRPAGSWHLERDHAVRLRGTKEAVLRINASRVWTTLDGPHSGHANNQGDRVLAAGEQLTVPAGQLARPNRRASAVLPSKLLRVANLDAIK